MAQWIKLTFRYLRSWLVFPFRICVPEKNMQQAWYMEFADRLCRRSAAFLIKFAIFAGWQSPLQKYISLPLHTSVSGISKRHAHKVFIKCPVSKLRLRLQTVETGHYFCSLMPLRNAKKPRQISWTKIYIFVKWCWGQKVFWPHDTNGLLRILCSRNPKTFEIRPNRATFSCFAGPQVILFHASMKSMNFWPWYHFICFRFSKVRHESCIEAKNCIILSA